jgi:hypothetical protein
MNDPLFPLDPADVLDCDEVSLPLACCRSVTIDWASRSMKEPLC